MTLEAALIVIEPREPLRTIRWAIAEGFTETGQPYSDFAYPHLGAPGGPFDAFDCPTIFDIWLQWASRLGKTFGGQIAMLKQADREPCPMMFASSDEKLAVEVVSRTYGMIGHVRQLSDRLPPPNRRKQSSVDLRFCRMYVAWARSVSTLADKAVRLGHANEIDKWEHLQTSKEADPLKLFDDRSKEFPTFKRWKEGTPALKSKSRVERGRLGSCNAALYVPCPHCGRHQTLRMGDGSSPGGIVWSKNEAGKSEKDLARKTARYICVHCEGEVGDEHRGLMMRGGVWVPEGCGVDDDKAREIARTWREREAPWQGWSDAPWITGEPARDGRDWGSQLSSLYALSRSWGDIAAEFVDSQKNAQNLRNFVNQWLAETWEAIKRKQTWEQLYDRLVCDIDRLLVPDWASLITLGADRQQDRIRYSVDAWGPDDRSHTVDYGECDDLRQLYNDVIGRKYAYADGEGVLKLSFGLIDSGYKPDGVYELCRDCVRNRLNIWPCKGSSKPLNAEFRVATLDDKTSAPGMRLVHVDTQRSQDWIDKILHELPPDSPGSATVFNAPAWEHQGLCEELLNDAAVEDLDASNNEKITWQRANTGIPNDLRDCRRYSWVAKLIATRGGKVPERRKSQQTKPPPKPTAKVPQTQFLQRPGGWIPPRRNG